MTLKEITEYCNNYIYAHNVLTNTIGENHLTEYQQVYLKAITIIRNHSLHCISTDDLKISLIAANNHIDNKQLESTINSILTHNFNLPFNILS